MQGNGAEAFGRLAGALAEMPDTIEKLLATHRGSLDDTLPRCVACTEPGTGRPGAPWPCSIHGLATLANELRRRRSE